MYKKSILFLFILFISQLPNSIISSGILAQSPADKYKSGKIEFIEEWRIGGDTGDEKYILSRPTDIAYDSRGNLFILDSRDKCIKKYSPAGKHIITFGRKGQGPGEMTRPYNIEIDPDDNIVVYDFSGRRFSVFSNDGENIATKRFNERIWIFCITHSGKYLIETHKWNLKPGKGDLHKIILYSPDLTYEMTIDSAYVNENLFVSEGNRFTNIPVPFHDRLFWTILPSENIVTAWSGDYNIKIFTPEGDVIKSFRHKGKKIKVTAKDKNEHFNSLGFATSDGGASKGVPQFVRDKTELPKYKPFFTYILADNEGNILVRLYEKKGNNYLWDVFDKNGKYLTKIALPEFNRWITFYNKHIATIIYAEDEFPVVVQYRIK